MVSFHNNLVILGGRTTGTSGFPLYNPTEPLTSTCYLLQCNDGVFTWQKMKCKMLKERSHFVAIKISESYAKQWTS